MSVILMTTLFYKALILQGEIWCWTLLGLKGLINPNIKFEFSFAAPIHFLQTGSGKLIKYQANSSRLIMSVILMTALFYKALIL